MGIQVLLLIVCKQDWTNFLVFLIFEEKVIAELFELSKDKLV